MPRTFVPATILTLLATALAAVDDLALYRQVIYVANDYVAQAAFDALKEYDEGEEILFTFITAPTERITDDSRGVKYKQRRVKASLAYLAFHERQEFSKRFPKVFEIVTKPGIVMEDRSELIQLIKAAYDLEPDTYRERLVASILARLKPSGEHDRWDIRPYIEYISALIDTTSQPRVALYPLLPDLIRGTGKDTFFGDDQETCARLANRLMGSAIKIDQKSSRNDDSIRANFQAYHENTFLPSISAGGSATASVTNPKQP